MKGEKQCNAPWSWLLILLGLSTGRQDLCSSSYASYKKLQQRNLVPSLSSAAWCVSFSTASERLEPACTSWTSVAHQGWLFPNHNCLEAGYIILKKLEPLPGIRSLRSSSMTHQQTQERADMQCQPRHPARSPSLTLTSSKMLPFDLRIQIWGNLSSALKLKKKNILRLIWHTKYLRHSVICMQWVASVTEQVCFDTIMHPVLTWVSLRFPFPDTGTVIVVCKVFRKEPYILLVH